MKIHSSTKWVALLVTMALCMGVTAAEDKAVNAATNKAPVKLACVGDSITQGVGASQGHAYPHLLKTMLGDQWEVRNFGLSGTTLLKNGDVSYWKCKQFTDATAFVPDVVTIALGTNDSKPQNWAHKDQFLADYKALIEEFRKVNPKVIVYACLPVPAFPGRWGINEPAISGEVIPLIRQAAEESKAEVIDLHAALAGRNTCFPDTVHPNDAGQTLIAQAIARTLTNKTTAVSK